MKRLLAVLLTLCLLLSLGASAFADNRAPVNYSFDKNTGILYINGSGPMPDFNTDATPWSKQAIYIKRVVIAPGITTIGNEAFEYCYNLERVDIPLSVTRIGDYAFYQCGHLKSIYIPEKVNYIGKYAFDHCEEITTITIPNGVKVLPECCFNSCYDLNYVTIPKSVTVIENNAFNGCKKIKSVLFGGSSSQYRNLRIDHDNEFFTNAPTILGGDSTAVDHINTQICDAIQRTMYSPNIFYGTFEHGIQYFVSDPYVDEIFIYFARNPHGSDDEAYAYISDFTDMQTRLADMTALYKDYGYALSIIFLPEAANDMGSDSYDDRVRTSNDGYLYACMAEGKITKSILHYMNKDIKTYLEPGLIESNYPYDGSYSSIDEKNITKIADRYL